MHASRFLFTVTVFVALPAAVSAQLIQPGDVLVVSETLGNPSTPSAQTSTLRVFDGCTGAFKLGSTDTMWMASGAGRFVEVSPDGTLWVSDPSSERLFQYDRDLNRMCLTPSAGTNHIRGFGFASATSIWAVGGAYSTGPLVHLDGQSCSILGQHSGLGFEPVDAAWHVSGRLCVTTYTDATGVRLVNPATSATEQILDCGGSLGGWLMSCDTTSSGLIVVTDNNNQRIVALDSSQSGAAQCAWSIATSADAYPWLAGVEVDEHRQRVYTAVRRSGTWWLEAFDANSRARVLSIDIGGMSIHNLAVVPGGDCSPRTYCSSGISTNLCQPSMSATGVPSASASAGFVLSATLVEGQRSGLIFYGITGRNDSPWGCTSTSRLCVKAPTQRMSASGSGGTLNQCNGVIAEDWLAFLASHAGALGQPFAAGDLVTAQCWYRDPPSCKSTNLSNGLEWVVQP
jgi:hypothetical protein